MATSKQARSKAWGYEVEIAALAKLKRIFPKLRRTGSTAYSKAAADLIQDGGGVPLYVIATRDKRRPLLVTMEIDDLLGLVDQQRDDVQVYVQVKGRASTWIGSLYGQLRANARPLT